MSGREDTKVRDREQPDLDGLTSSYEEFVAARSADLYRAAFLMTGNAADAQDVLQTALIKMYVGWAKVRAAQSPEAYAHRLLTNTFISGRRPVRYTREQLVNAPPDHVATYAAPADPDERLDMWARVITLPVRQRAVIVLRYYVGSSEAEIAEALGCATGTVKSTAAAALRNLRTRMGEPS